MCIWLSSCASNHEYLRCCSYIQTCSYIGWVQRSITVQWENSVASVESAGRKGLAYPSPPKDQCRRSVQTKEGCLFRVNKLPSANPSAPEAFSDLDLKLSTRESGCFSLNWWSLFLLWPLGGIRKSVQCWDKNEDENTEIVIIYRATKLLVLAVYPSFTHGSVRLA